jgi:hypothetical protein
MNPFVVFECCLFVYFLKWLQDEVVKLSPHARAIRDVEDEELRNFFYGMSPWQVNLFCLFAVKFFFFEKSLFLN